MKYLVLILFFMQIPVMFFRESHSPLQKCATMSGDVKKGQFVRMIFYNVENLYDTKDDTTKLDEEFTSSGPKHWNWSRFTVKLNHLYKTLLAAGGSEPPSIACFCEIENKYVVNKLIYSTPMKNFGYKAIHYDSPDLRGVDVAMIYLPDKFRPVFSKPIRIIFPFDTTVRTRDILYVKGILAETDTVHIFVNHWPSRRGGLTQSQPRRNYVASVVKAFTDSLFRDNKAARIIIMGDFNDEPDCESLRVVLGAFGPETGPSPSLFNMMTKFGETGKGTHRFRGHWGILDQFIISDALLDTSNVISVRKQDVNIFSASYLTTEDEKYMGQSPVRTYAGPRYLGGFSDHMPVMLDLKIKIP